MKNISKAITMGALILTLAGCGHSEGDRLASGAGLGAGAGAVVGAVTGGGVGTGALVGGALGAAAGGLTNSHQLDLGRPLWR